MLELLHKLTVLAGEFGIDVEQVIKFLTSPLVAVLSILSSAAFILVKYLHVEIHEVAVYIWRLGCFVCRRLIGGRTIIVLTDLDASGDLGATFYNRLQKKIRNDRRRNVSILQLDTGDQLLANPIFPFLVESVVIVMTDVTRLSNDVVRRKYVQKKLQAFVRSGGSLILTHDVIYRRVQNEILQTLAGATASHFYPSNGLVEYVRVTNGHRCSGDMSLLTKLPPRLQLGDNEVMWGPWVEDVEFLYVWSQQTEIPLATRRPLGKGLVFWLNSGDQNADGPPPSVVRPDSPLVPLISTILNHIRSS